MKKLTILMLLIIIPAILMSTTYHVYNGNSIQSIINNAQNGDSIQVHYYYPGYEGFDFDGKSLEIFSQGSPVPVIDGDLSNPSLNIVIDMTEINNPNEAPPKLHGFKIIGSSSAVGVKLTGFDGLSDAQIYHSTIDGVDIGILVGNNDKRIDIYNNTFLDNNIAYKSVESSTNIGFADKFRYNTVYDNDTGMYLGNRSNTSAARCLFYNNDDVSIDLTNDTEHTNAYLDLSLSTISHDSSSNTSTGVFVCQYDTLNVENCIIYGNDTQIDDDGDVIVTYSDIENGYTGTGNIDADPYFCMETNYEFRLMEGSPCIDTGDPTTTGGDVQIDMGCYETTIDIKKCEGEHWNWVSYPRLYRTNNDNINVVPLLENFLDWDFHLGMLYDVIFFIDPTLEYEDLYSDWTPDDYDVKSSLGYKLDPDDTGAHYLPTVSNATRLADNWKLTYTFEEGDDCWMGYWLPYTQNIEDAFGKFFDDLVSVSAEDWYYEYSKHETPSSSTTNKDMIYGKGYVVYFETEIDSFYWTDDTGRGNRDPGYTRPEPEYFTYDDLPDYEAIDVMDIPSNVVEIGVFEDDVCVGAAVVQNEDEQILAYTSSSNRDLLPLTFEVVTNNRGESLTVRDYRVLNKETGKYENRFLISGQQKSSVILFGELLEHQNNTPDIGIAVLHGNYPNPFNPAAAGIGRSSITSISFSLPKEQDIELVVYNMKGQTVRKLAQGQFTSGEHSVTWDGTDNNSKQVGSGLYFYKLKTADQDISKKMLLLK